MGALQKHARFTWPVDPQGHAVGYAWLKLRPVDLAAIGQLFLDDGAWNGRQATPADWARTATINQIEAPVTQRASDGYGFMWWVRKAGDPPAFAAVGGGGQLVEVIPDLGLVVVTAVDFDPYQDVTDEGVDSLLTLELAESVRVPISQAGDERLSWPWARCKGPA